MTGSPAYHVDCLPWFMAQPFAILGVDVPCIERARSWPDGSEATGNMLIPLFERGILLLAPLVNRESDIRMPVPPVDRAAAQHPGGQRRAGAGQFS